MSDQSAYQPPDQNSLPRFAGVRTFMRLPIGLPHTGLDYGVVGIPLDSATTFRAGARFGPEAIRSMSVLFRGYNPDLDVDIVEVLRGLDVGDCRVVPGYMEESYRVIEADLNALVGSGAVPIVLGGDHSVSLPVLRALAAKHGPMALVDFDAHTDTRDAHLGQLYGHGTVFRRACEEQLIEPSESVQVGVRGSLTSSRDLADARALGFKVIEMSEVRKSAVQDVAKAIEDRVGMRSAYLSFDIDALDPAFAPGTGTPTAGGFTTADALSLMGSLRGIHFVGMDVVEVSPPYDHAGITALAAAAVAWQFLSLLAARGRDRPGA